MTQSVRDWQADLARAGKYGGKVDGDFGLMTLAASRMLLPVDLPPPSPVATDTVLTKAMIYQGSARYPVTEVILHCPATRPDWMAGAPMAAKVAEIRRWHMKDRGWKDVGYHYLIDRDGTIMPGRAETVIGAGVEGHNRGIIHICIFGGFDSAATDKFERNYTTAQDALARKLIAAIKLRTGIKLVRGHNDYAAKACPGFEVADWL